MARVTRDTCRLTLPLPLPLPVSAPPSPSPAPAPAPSPSLILPLLPPSPAPPLLLARQLTVLEQRSEDMTEATPCIFVTVRTWPRPPPLIRHGALHPRAPTSASSAGLLIRRRLLQGHARPRLHSGVRHAARTCARTLHRRSRTLHRRSGPQSRYAQSRYARRLLYTVHDTVRCTPATGPRT
jgi:hypothetical protein